MATEGILLHLLDSYIFVHGDVAGRAGDGRYGQLGYISASLIHSKQKQRFGKIPIYDINDAGRLGGVVIRAGTSGTGISGTGISGGTSVALDAPLGAARIKCMYLADAGSWNIPGGCKEELGWCDAYVNAPLDNPCRGAEADSYDCKCCTKLGCYGQAMKLWRSEHVDAFVNFHAKYGGDAVCCGSGYNEVILAGGEEWNAALPAVIESFFYEKERRREIAWGGGAPGHIRELRTQFCAHWKLSTDSDGSCPPLLEFDRTNFVEPFSIPEPW